MPSQDAEPFSLGSSQLRDAASWHCGGEVPTAFSVVWLMSANALRLVMFRNTKRDPGAEDLGLSSEVLEHDREAAHHGLFSRVDLQDVNCVDFPRTGVWVPFDCESRHTCPTGFELDLGFALPFET